MFAGVIGIDLKRLPLSGTARERQQNQGLSSRERRL